MADHAGKVRTHFTWYIEHPLGECPFCGDKTVLVIAPELWGADEESAIESVGQSRYDGEFSIGVTVRDEVTGHFCGTCEKLVSLSLNSIP